MKELPDSTIIIKDGVVVKIEEWTMWGQRPCRTMLIERNPDGTFLFDDYDPEHSGLLGGPSFSINQIAERYHPEIGKKYRELLSMTDATEEKVKQHYSYEVVVTGG